MLEIWCDLPPQTARHRFQARHPRHPIHGELPAADDDWQHWQRTARPLQLDPVLRVDTTRPADAQAITAWIQAPERHSPPATG